MIVTYKIDGLYSAATSIGLICLQQTKESAAALIAAAVEGIDPDPDLYLVAPEVWRATYLSALGHEILNCRDAAESMRFVWSEVAVQRLERERQILAERHRQERLRAEQDRQRVAGEEAAKRRAEEATTRQAEEAELARLLVVRNKDGSGVLFKDNKQIRQLKSGELGPAGVKERQWA